MKRNMKSDLRAILIVNCAACLLFCGVSFYNSWIASLGGPMQITALDREGVIDESKLKEFQPGLVKNLRHDLGMWVAQKERYAAIRTAEVGIVVAGINVILVLVLWWNRAK